MRGKKKFQSVALTIAAGIVLLGLPATPALAAPNPGSGPEAGGTNVSDALPGVLFERVASGRSHGLAVTTDGEVYSWGQQENGRLGNGNNTDAEVKNPAPIQAGAIPAGVTALDVAAGNYASAVLGSDGNVYTFGRNADGELGIGTPGTPVDSAVPVEAMVGPAIGNAPITQIDAGLNFFVALDANGNVWAWGENEEGQLGRGGPVPHDDSQNSGNPQQINDGAMTPGSVVTKISAGSDFAHAIVGGTLYGWGKNQYGEIGDGFGDNSSAHTFSRSEPVLVDTSNVPAGTQFATVDGGFDHTVAIDTNGQVYSWGRANRSQLARSGNQLVPGPIVQGQMPGGVSVVGIAAGNQVSVALGATAMPTRGGATSPTAASSAPGKRE